MFNLLPSILKEKIRSEYHLRLFVVVLVSIIVIQVSFLIFLSPTWFVSLNKEQEIIFQSERSNKLSLDLKVEAINTQINSINDRLATINSALEYPRVIPIVDEILSKKTKEITVKELMFETTGKNSGKVKLSGGSLNRDSLVAFVKDLEELDKFKSVDLPISNLTKEKDIDFSIEIIVEI